MDVASRSRLVKTWALEEGFDRVGLATLEPLERGDVFERWLARGDHAEMQYLERRAEVRQEPQRILSGARSAICVAYQYYPLDGEEAVEGDLWPFVARYARGLDYHDSMIRGLRRLAERVREAFPGSECRPYVDTGPVLERELAARAGLGAVGKNTNLLDATAGSWFLLGELFTTLELVRDSPISDLCGSCTECLTACPTEALPQPYRLDSRRCISYWTIEHRGEIPSEVRAKVGHWVFGCDICQEVCPLNARTDSGDHEELQMSQEKRQLGLVDLLLLDRDRYTRVFRGSPMKRSKLEGLQRNAAVAIGNRRSRRYLPALVEAISNTTPMVRRHVAWALGRVGGDVARQALRKALARETDTDVRAEIERALEASGD